MYMHVLPMYGCVLSLCVWSVSVHVYGLPPSVYVAYMCVVCVDVYACVAYVCV